MPHVIRVRTFVIVIKDVARALNARLRILHIPHVVRSTRVLAVSVYVCACVVAR